MDKDPDGCFFIIIKQIMNLYILIVTNLSQVDSNAALPTYPILQA